MAKRTITIKNFTTTGFCLDPPLSVVLPAGAEQSFTITVPQLRQLQRAYPRLEPTELRVVGDAPAGWELRCQARLGFRYAGVIR
jgi:hypothetical protein